MLSKECGESWSGSQITTYSHSGLLREAGCECFAEDMKELISNPGYLFNCVILDDTIGVHCVRDADTFEEDQIVNALSTRFSWTYLRTLASFEEELKLAFYRG